MKERGSGKQKRAWSQSIQPQRVSLMWERSSHCQGSHFFKNCVCIMFENVVLGRHLARQAHRLTTPAPQSALAASVSWPLFILRIQVSALPTPAQGAWGAPRDPSSPAAEAACRLREGTLAFLPWQYCFSLQHSKLLPHSILYPTIITFPNPPELPAMPPTPWWFQALGATIG